MKIVRHQRGWKWALALVLVAIVAGIAFVFLPRLLVASANTASANVILHFATTSRHNSADDYVVQLYQQNLAKKIVCISRGEACGVYPADDTRRRLLARGIPAEDVLTLYLPYADCVAPNLPRIIEMVRANGWQQSLMVLSPTRSRVTGNIAAKYFQQAGLGLTITYSPQAYQEVTTRWWADHQKAQATTEAIISTFLDPLYAECR